MRRNNTCDACIRKKRKCDRNRPRCSNCIASGIDCHYSETRQQAKAADGNQKQLEERLHKLEAMLNNIGGVDAFSFMSERNLFLPIQTPEVVMTPPRSTDIPFDIKQQLLENYREDLISLSFKLINHKYLFLSEEYLRQSSARSPMVLHSMHALGSLVSTPTSLPQGVGSRTEMALVYFEKALSFFALVISNPSEQGVLSLFLLTMAALKMDKVPEGLAYFQLSISMAKEIGINQEVTLTSLTSFDYERENLRGLWWCLFLIDRFLFEKNCNLIEDKDNQIYMPGYDKSPYYQTQDKLPVFGLQVMSSTEWFTPGLPNQSLDGYRVLLVRIFGRALKFNYLTKHQPNSAAVESPLFIMASIEGSLREWWLSLPEYIISHLSLAQSDQPISDPEYTWRVVYTCVQYNHIRSLVFHPCLLKNTLESATESAKSRAFVGSLNIAHENAKVLSAYLRRNQQFEHCTSTMGSYIFHTAFPLVLASRMKLPEHELAQIKESLDIHVQCLRQNTIQFEVTPILIETLDYLISLHDPVDIIAQFSRFQAMSGKAPSNLKILEEPPIKASPTNQYSSPSSNWNESSSSFPNPNLNPNLNLSNPLTSSATLASSMNGIASQMSNGMTLMQPDKVMWDQSVMDPMQMNLTPNYIDMLLSSDPFFQNQ